MFPDNAGYKGAEAPGFPVGLYWGYPPGDPGYAPGAPGYPRLTWGNGYPVAPGAPGMVGGFGALCFFDMASITNKFSFLS